MLFGEKRDLGVNCKEIVIEDGDILAAFLNISGTIEDADYVVVKVPVGRVSFHEALSKLGFIYIEGSINFTQILKMSFYLQSYMQKGGCRL